VARDALIDQVKKQRGGTADEAPRQPSTGERQGQQMGQTGYQAGAQQKPHNLPRKILQDLLRR
jgi:hypothetical protein